MVPPTFKPRLAIVALAVLAAALSLACDLGSDSPEPTPSPRGTTATAPAPPPAALSQPAANNEFTLNITRRLRYIWPAEGAITSYFGTGHPTGIDIALDLNADSPIRASGDGTVSYAGGDACCSLGNRVEVEHPGGGRTVYGHLATISVQEGQVVRQGDVLGLGGNTGDSDGKHLHFEVYQNNVLVDPLRYLPATQQSISGTERLSCAQTTVRLDPDSELELRVMPQTLSGYEIQTVAYTGITPAARTLGVEATKRSVLTVGLRVPALPAATGETLEAGLDIVMGAPGGAGDQQVTCRLVLRSRATLPNPPGTGERHIAGIESPAGSPAEPTPTPTRTPIIGQFTAPTPRVTATPFTKPTATPFAPRPITPR